MKRQSVIREKRDEREKIQENGGLTYLAHEIPDERALSARKCDSILRYAESKQPISDVQALLQIDPRPRTSTHPVKLLSPSPRRASAIGMPHRKVAMASRITTNFASTNFDVVVGRWNRITGSSAASPDTGDDAPPCRPQLVATTRAPKLAEACLRRRPIASCAS